MVPYSMVAGERLFYALVEGDPAREHNLILVHGAGGDHTHWPAGLRRLSRVNVFAVDLPGHGRSAGRGRTRVGDYADSVHLFAQTLGLKQASVVGHSMGGAIAQILALRQPRWLASVVLVSTGARLPVNPLILEGLRSASNESSLTEPSTTSFEASIDMICQWAYGPTVSEQILRKGRQLLLSVDLNVIYGDYIACDNFDVMDRVREIELPTLIIVGSADQMTPPKYGLYLHEQIADSELLEIRDGGHMVALEKPAEVTRAATRFLKIL